TCPHSIRPHDGALWLCNSGYGELALIPKAAPGASIEVVCRLPGFTRGLAFSSTYAFVGLSRVIESYEPYAPGVPPEASRCGVAVIDLKRGDVAASMYWTKGYQVFDVQALAGLPSVQLPFDPAAAGAVNGYLRYLG
ncbi:MAG: DUF4915 domain-containing protein, partial [Alphaproteobacteria bacterium]|nr:DUF4915 domain-containing protein [Alphaproteobacteria bacterium]